MNSGKSVPDYLGILSLAQFKLNGQEYKGELVRDIEAFQEERDRLAREKRRLETILEDAQQALTDSPYKGDLVWGIELLRKEVENLRKESHQKALDEAYRLSIKLGEFAEELRQLSLRGR